jgi:asparagine synthase (glutamine-hydrolysing)
MKIDLQLNKGFLWTNDSDIWAKGFLFDSNNILFEEEKILDYFVGIKNKEEFEYKLKHANGFFSVVIQHEDRVFAAVDCIRSHPLFYSKKFQWVGDNPESLQTNHALKKDSVSMCEFFATGYVTGNQTIYEGIYQLQAGQYLIIENNTCRLNTYYQYLHQDFIDYTEEKARIELDKCVTNAMERLITYANGRQLVIPLSGGYDSRLIALKLKELKYENVVCFTYGKKGNWEAIISKKVADELGFRWKFIDYEPIAKTRYASADILKYDQFSHRTVSLPHVQDLFAVHQLKEKKIIESNALFIPGHSGDFLAGSHLSKLECSDSVLKKEEIITRTIKKHYGLFKLSGLQREVCSKKVCKNLEKSPKDGDNSSLLDCWNWQERQSKFIVNSCRVYEFYGYQWYCPLWDKEIMEYFRTLTLKLRENRWLYNTYINKQNVVLEIKESKYKASLAIFFKQIIRTIINKMKCLDFVMVFKGYLDVKSHVLCLDYTLSVKQYIRLSLQGHRTINGIELFLFSQRSKK